MLGLIPNATRATAFLSGASLVAIATILDVLKARGLISYNAESPEVFPFLLVYFFVTAVVFVLGLRNLFPRELRTRIPLVYLPTDRKGWRFLLRLWGRILAWFLGGAAVTVLSVCMQQVL